MSTLAGGSGEWNKEQEDTTIGGKDQLKLNEEARACLSPSPSTWPWSWSSRPCLVQPPQRDQPCSPGSGDLQWLGCLLLAALKHASMCTRGHTDVQVQLGTWGECPRKEQRRSGSRLPEPTVRLRLQDSSEGPQATELSLSPPPYRWGQCGPKTRMMPRLCSTSKGGRRKQAELRGQSLSPLAPSAFPPGVSSPGSTLGTKCM